jgi:hypothetical protein
MTLGPKETVIASAFAGTRDWLASAACRTLYASNQTFHPFHPRAK